MPRETFLNLSDQKQERICEILLDVYLDKSPSLVTVTEIVEKMEMSRSAFYKYFVDLEDAHHYIVKKYTLILQGDILSKMMIHKNDFFGGIRFYLAQCSEYKPGELSWKIIHFLTQGDNSQRDRRINTANNWGILHKWVDILEANEFTITRDDEAISFLYFVMDLVTNCLVDYMVNDWTQAELLADYDFKTKWLLNGLH